MATHSSILAWKILWTEEPGGLQSMGSRRVRHNLATEHTHTHTHTHRNFSYAVHFHFGKSDRCMLFSGQVLNLSQLTLPEFP